MLSKQNNNREEYSTVQILLENLLTIANITVGIWAMWDVSFFNIPIISIIYLGFILFMHIIFLRKHLCTHCIYYGRACHCGWGKLALMFQKNSGDIKKAKIAAGITWGVLMVFPILIATVLSIIDFKCLRIVQIGILIIILIIQTIVHKKNCSSCKMRDTCCGAMK